MLSYLIVIRLKKLENRLRTDKKPYRHEDIQMNTKTKRKSKKPTLSLVNAGPSDRVSVLTTKCGGCHPKGLIVASSHRIKQITILTNLCKARHSIVLYFH